MGAGTEGIEELDGLVGAEDLDGGAEFTEGVGDAVDDLAVEDDE